MVNNLKIRENTVLVILGASGDLAKKKLEKRCLLPSSFRVVGFAPDNMAHDAFIQIASAGAKLESPRFAEQHQDFIARCSYVSGHEGGDNSFQALRARLEELGEGKKEQHRLFYMALPPTAFVPVSAGLKKFCYSGRGTSRIIVEKPFGHDLDSSRALQRALDEHWVEDEIFRIDHYLGKEIVNNLLVIRFGNVIFESIWNKLHIDNVEISVIEAGGAEGRGSYFNSTGAIRDVMQNHMMQVLAILTMERPKSFSADDLGAEKVRVMNWMPPIDHQRTIIGQYGKSKDGEKPAFKDEKDVEQDSRCVTFCAAVVHIENDRWSGVPFLLKAGKDLALDESEATITINFRPTPNASIFDATVPNCMTIRIQPDEGVFLKINSFVPSLETKTAAIDLDLTYHGREIPEAYEALLLDTLKGDFSRSVRADEVDASWAIFTPLLKYLEDEEIVPREYAYGSTGPQGLDEFISSYQYKTAALF
ncbi:MAG: hypothetical protein Q9217_001037 [Psora testacea]